MTDRPNRLTYRDAGVDIDAGEALVQRIGPAAAETRRPGVMDVLGGFGASFDPRAAGFEDPILVAATDGVGTKLMLAKDVGDFGGVGIDLVAMCVNDLVCQGAEPLFFLDYFATGKLDVDQAAAVVASIAQGCRQAGCALIGGETAEMPGLYRPGDFDLAGFAVGALERGTDLPRPVGEGDVLLGLGSSGVHSNGFSLVRKIIADHALPLDGAVPWADRPLGAALLTPTRIYVPQVLPLIRAGHVAAMAHITGGGLTENVPRALPDGLGAEIDLDAWALPGVFRWLMDKSGLAQAEALRTFNCGIGFVLVVAEADIDAATARLAEAGETPQRIGRVVPGDGVRYRGSLS